MTVEEIQKDLIYVDEVNANIPMESVTEYIKLMYPVYVTHSPKVQFIRGYVYDRIYNFIFNDEECGLSVGISLDTPSDNGQVLTMPVGNLDKTIFAFLKHLSISMRLSALQLD